MEKNKVVYIFIGFIIFLVAIFFLLFFPVDSTPGFPLFEPGYLPESVGGLVREEIRNLTLSVEYKRSYAYGNETGFYIFENKFYENKSDEKRMQSDFDDFKSERWNIVQKTEVSGFPALYVKERERYGRLYVYREGCRILISVSPQDPQLSKDELEKIASSLKRSQI